MSNGNLNPFPKPDGLGTWPWYGQLLYYVLIYLAISAPALFAAWQSYEASKHASVAAMQSQDNAQKITEVKTSADQAAKSSKIAIQKIDDKMGGASE